MIRWSGSVCLSVCPGVERGLRRVARLLLALICGGIASALPTGAQRGGDVGAGIPGASLPHVTGNVSATRSAVPTVTGKRVGTLKSEVPTGTEFVLHGTMPVPTQNFARDTCPYVVVDPDGTPHATQWELVAVTANHMVVELLAPIENTGGWTGRQTFDVYVGTNPYDVSQFEPAVLAALGTKGVLRVRLEDQNGVHRYAELTDRTVPHTIYRVGPAKITIERVFQGAGGLQAWLSARANSDEIEVILNWHNGGLPARPDLYFSSLALEVPAGYTWTPLLPDPAMSVPMLVRKGRHVLPQRWERSFRVIVHPIGKAPDLSYRGWAVGDWSQGGYLAQSLRLPDLSHTNIDLAPKQIDDFDRLENLLPSVPGTTPVSNLWPAHGVFYGGMTGGVEIYQYPSVPLAFSGQPEGMLSNFVEQLRYASRQMGCIYADDGQPIEQEDYLNPDGTQPFNLFNNAFIGYPTPDDAPFDFSQTGPGVGSAPYDPNDYSPVDYQHFVRRTNANKTLVWLDNDPLARLYMMMDAELGRMCFYEGPGGRLPKPAVFGLGTIMGRAEAWIGDLMATAHALAPIEWRVRNQAWFTTYVAALRSSQLPTGLFSAINYGKMATSMPFGNGSVASYWVYRSNEQIFLMHALRGIQESVGIDCRNLLRSCGDGLWNFAWKVGTDGPLDTYPAGPVGGARYVSRSEIPAGLTTSVLRDAWHVANALADAERAGANMVPAVLALTKSSHVAGARAVFEGWGLQNIANRASALSLMQELAP